MTNDFNFARRPFVNERLPRTVFILAATLVIGTTLVHGFFLARYLVREQEELDLQVSELREAIEATEMATSEARIPFSMVPSLASSRSASDRDWRAGR